MTRRNQKTKNQPKETPKSSANRETPEKHLNRTRLVGGFLVFLFVIGAIADAFGTWTGIRDLAISIFQPSSNAKPSPIPTDVRPINAVTFPPLDPRTPTPIPAPILSSPAAMSCINSDYALEFTNSHGEIVRCYYTTRGLLAGVTDTSGYQVSYNYDIANRLVLYADNQGNRVRINQEPPSDYSRDDFAFGLTPEASVKGGIDGIFIHEDRTRSEVCGKVYKVLRLYEDGLVLDIDICSTENIENVWSDSFSEWYYRENQEIGARGEYYVLGYNIWFSTKGNGIVIDYFGAFTDKTIVLNSFNRNSQFRSLEVQYAKVFRKSR